MFSPLVKIKVSGGPLRLYTVIGSKELSEIERLVYDTCTRLICPFEQRFLLLPNLLANAPTKNIHKTIIFKELGVGSRFTFHS